MDSFENLVRTVEHLDRETHMHTKFCKKFWTVHLSRLFLGIFSICMTLTVAQMAGREGVG